jgi:hypothetical protein
MAVSIEQYRLAHSTFREKEPRDLFYRAATELVALALERKTKLSVGEALAVLLRTWNMQFYRFHVKGVDLASHFERLETLYEQNKAMLAPLRVRTISSLKPDEKDGICNLFQNFETLLGGVGAVKALHLLAPKFFRFGIRRLLRHITLDLTQLDIGHLC